MNSELAPTGKKLTKKQLNELANFVDPATILTQLARHGWTVEKAIENLVQIAQDGTKESTRLNAIKYLNTLLLDAMSRSGLMVLATKTMKGEAGEEVKFSGKLVSRTLRSQSQDSAPEETTMEDLLTPLLKGKENNEQDDEYPMETPEESDTPETQTLDDSPDGEGAEDPTSAGAPDGDEDGDREAVGMCLTKSPRTDGADNHFGGIATSGPPAETLSFLGVRS